jgi:hypothetical protein
MTHVRHRFWYRRIHALLRHESINANHKRIFLLYQDAGLAIQRLCKVLLLSGRNWDYKVALTKYDRWKLSLMHIIGVHEQPLILVWEVINMRLITPCAQEEV